MCSWPICCRSITCSWPICCSLAGPSCVISPSVAGPSCLPGSSVAGPSCLPGPSVADPEFQDHAPVAGTNTVLHTSPSCSEETLQLASLKSSSTSKTLYKTVENEYSKNVTKKLLNSPPNCQALCCTNDTSPFQTIY